MSDGFSIGGLALDNWSTPQKIGLPAAQKVNKHVLVGGYRVVDAMGSDPEDISWSGRARGQDAASQMMAVRAMCQAGSPVSLTWNEYAFSVIITKFVPEYKMPTEWEYSITCMIVDDDGGGAGLGGGLSLDGLIGGDLSTVLGMATSLADDALSSISDMF